METLKNLKILLGVTGSIAAYKSPLLVREFIKAGASVNVVMTPSAKHFVTKTVLSNLSGNTVVCDMFDEELQDKGAWHIQLAHWCDLMLIAPCTATTIARIATGLCDTALSTLALALPTDKKLIVSPAMDSSMWEHPATQKNIETLKQYGAYIIPPDTGELSSGLSGLGRMPEIDVIMKFIDDVLAKEPENLSKSSDELKKKSEHRQSIDENQDSFEVAVQKDKLNAEIDLAEMQNDMAFLEEIGKNLKGRKILITAGPTHEKIDDVRFIGNYSSGKMGFALADEAQKAGAIVTLISGPVSLDTPTGVKRINVESAEEMFKEVMKEFERSDIAILSAAVADYTPMQKQEGKIKKEDTGDFLKLELKTTDDILRNLGLMKKPGQKLIGFALESSDEISNGWKKLKTKNWNMIVV
ncbi:bifunctional phosphopantothenoylcysteine decarboxylase/phosphopantothenate synthase, partial [Bacteroidetes/Chlorobi group bacterium ChocPot_Mid]